MATEFVEPMQRGPCFSRHPAAVRAVTREEYSLHCSCSHPGPKDCSYSSSCINWFSKHCCCCLQLFSSCVLLNKANLSRTDQAYCMPSSSKSWKPLTGLWEPHTCRNYFTTYYCFYLLLKKQHQMYQVKSPALDATKQRILTLSLPSQFVCHMPYSPLPSPALSHKILAGQVTVLFSWLSSKPYVEAPPDEALV